MQNNNVAKCRFSSPLKSAFSPVEKTTIKAACAARDASEMLVVISVGLLQMFGCGDRLQQTNDAGRKNDGAEEPRLYLSALHIYIIERIK